MKFQKSACIEPMYYELPFIDRFQAAAKDGFAYVEFWNWTDKNAEDIRKAAEDAGIGIAGFNGDADLSLIDPATQTQYLDYLKRSVDFALQVGSKSVTIHSNGLGEHGYVIHSYPELSDTVKTCTMFQLLKECAKLGEESGIQMNLEALNVTTDHVGNYLKYTRDAAEMTGLIGSPKLKVLYDVYHMQLNEGSICDTIRKYVDQLGHIHVADAPGRHEPGTGEINYSKVFQCLEESGYKGLIGYELIPQNSTAEAVKAIMSF